MPKPLGFRSKRSERLGEPTRLADQRLIERPSSAQQPSTSFASRAAGGDSGRTPEPNSSRSASIETSQLIRWVQLARTSTFTSHLTYSEAMRESCSSIWCASSTERRSELPAHNNGTRANIEPG